MASTIAQQAVKSPNWQSKGYSFTEKQAYVISRAALEHKLVKKHVVFDHYEPEPKKYKPSPGKVQTSSTKTAVGSVVTSKHGTGKISKIITKSSGYVEVTYSNGVKYKEMAFNLTGEDGKPLKNKPGAK